MVFMLSAPLYGQDARQITGVVKSADGETMPGVNVVERGTTNGIATNIDGQYSIRVPNNDTVVLIFSSVGYDRQEITIGNLRTVNVVMNESSQQLDEVVVVGYGIQSKASVVGSIVQASGDDLKRAVSGSDITAALSSQLPGVISLTSSGEPGGILTGESSTNLYIRGQNTWNNSGPLVLVDGVERPLMSVDPNEVESVSVLKDASATAVYGVKGANGVLLITTKRGIEGKTKLSVNYTATGIMLSKLPGMLDSYDALMAKNEMIEREVSLREASWADYTPYEVVARYKYRQSPEDKYIFPNVDWKDEMFKKMGFQHRVNVNAQGGNKTIKYFGQLSYLYEGDMMKKYDNGKGYDPSYAANRFNFRSNIDVNLTSTTKFKMNLAGSFSQKNTNYNNTGSTGRADQWMWAAVYGLAPDLFPAQYPDGYWGAYSEGGNNTVNPAAVVANMGVRKARETQLQSNFVLEQDLKMITKGLNAAVTLAFDNRIRSEGGIYDVANHGRPGEEATNIAYRQIYPSRYLENPDDESYYTVYLPASSGDYDWYVRPWSIRQEGVATGLENSWTSRLPVDRFLMYQFQLTYARKFGSHSVGATGVFKREESAKGAEFKRYREDWVFRVTYDYASRYMFEFNGAYNGSEKFGPGYRFDFFPSLGLGWYISNERFFSNIKWVDRLKVRYSIGIAGADDAGGRYLYEQQYAYGGAAHLVYNANNNSPYSFYRIASKANPDARWEQALKTNYGLEFGILKNLVSLSFDYFTENRTDILIAGNNRSVPVYYGFSPPAVNSGQVKSNGFEIELGLNKSINKDIDVWAKFSLTHTRNKVIFRDDPPLADDHMKAQDFRIGQNKRVLNTGYFYNNWDEVWASAPTETNDLQKLPGYYDQIDYDGNGVISSTYDSAPVGYSEVPENTGSLTLGASYRGLSFTIQFFGANNSNRYIGWDNYRNNTNVVYDHVGNYWSKDNPNASSFLPRWQTYAENIGHYYLYDASFIRLQNVELGYSFSNAGWAKKAGISNLRIFMNGNNLFFWSKLPDDRQTTYSGAGSATEGSYPSTRRINLGVEISF
ncbi:MAG: TonB-dependent receptor [Bacteroidales bacterium]|nr:TonB-dependent receptor [Bacteroidales bacterium]